MKPRILLALVLILSFVSAAQRGGRSTYRPSYKPSTYKPSTSRSGSYERNYSNTYEHTTPGASSNLYEIFAKSDRVNAVNHITKWEAIKAVLPHEKFKALKESNIEYQVAYENGSYEVLKSGEIVTSEFSITEDPKSISIKPRAVLKHKKIELLFDEIVWIKGKKIHADNIALKMLAKNGETYDVERITTENGEMRYMANIKEGIWIEPTKGDIEIVNKNLDRVFNKDMVQVISIVMDFKTDKLLNEEIGSKSIICKTKNDLISKLRAQKEGSTAFIIGHHEKGKFVTHNEKGAVLFELTPAEIDQISREKNINIFPLGCKTAFSEFNEGANMDLNSVELVRSLSRSLSSSTTFGELLQNITKSEPGLKFLVENNSFDAIKVEVLRETNWKSRRSGSSNSDSTEVEKQRVISTKTVKTTRIGSGYIFTVPYIASSTTYSSNYDTMYSPDYTPYDLYASERKKNIGWFWISIGVLALSWALLKLWNSESPLLMFRLITLCSIICIIIGAFRAC